MRRLILIVFTIAFLFAKNSYSGVDSTTFNSSVITSNTVLSKTTVYLMKGFNYVRNGANLTIPSGTLIYGDFETKGTLIIERGSKIFAVGTPDAPIVFTSERPVGTRAAGDWGGIIILGRSGINTVSGVDSAEIEGFGPGLGPIYGGQPRIDNDNSGILKFVRIEFPGINLTGISGNEINGLTMGGVGSGTTISFVQVSYSGDDSFEWFGGNVNCDHLIAFKGLDDDWDCDNGFRGRVQWGLSVRDTGIVDVSTSNGFEIDNNANTSNNFNNPRTRPLFSNMTVVGPYINTGLNLNSLWGRGAHTRRNNLACIYNSIIMGWKVGVRFDGSGIYNACTGDTIQLRNNIFAGNVRLADTAASTSFNGQSFLQNGSYNNTIFAAASSVQLANPFAVYPSIPLPANNVNNWMPLGGSPALGGADFTNPNLNGFTEVEYRGAFGTNNWTYLWAQFNPVSYIIIAPGFFDVSYIPEGFRNNSTGKLNQADTVRLYLAQNFSPYNIVDSSRGVVDSNSYLGRFTFHNAGSGTYYLVAKHRNHIETWSKSGGEFYTAGAVNNYSFTSSVNQAFGSNMVSISGLANTYGGDVNQDEVIDLGDIIAIFNDAATFDAGYIPSDVNGDFSADLSDLVIAFNNSGNFISVIRP